MDERYATLHVLPQAAGPVVPQDADPRTADRENPVRVHVVGADPLARLGLITLLDGCPGIRVTGESAPGPRVTVALRTQRPHVLVVHGLLPADQRAHLVQAAGEGVGVLTMGGPEPVDGSAGPDGHLPGTATAGQLAAGVILAAAGYTLVTAAAARHRARPAPRVSQVGTEELTERECEVLELLAHGLSNGEIAERLTLSEHTVKTHVQNTLHKLRLRNRVHAAIYAFEAGLRRPC
ncbi:response regulator transcription factor [Kitasatospora sp. NBC_01266]|jgi:DNA-binding NarL/FixJ family response regulator|uniref:response regulator transcription factor n=1 Tax=Kitasatospora sp. NBC_01266 TaxID=2903572 RepID=UPI002E379FD0|nr:response regulator transcription factor [Kitasatospora sp. NBC_01266]